MTQMLNGSLDFKVSDPDGMARYYGLLYKGKSGQEPIHGPLH